MIPLIDGHLDLAMNALGYDRDQTLPVAELRRRETHLTEADRGGATVSLPEMKRGNIRLCVATLFVRADRAWRMERSPLRADADSASPALAHGLAMGQLAYYRLLERQGLARVIESAGALDEAWSAQDAPLGLVLMIEGADPITRPDEIGLWRRLGIRMVSLAHILPTAYAHGNGGDGPLSAAGLDLLQRMADLKMGLDASHLSDRSFAEALDAFPGAVCATHTNCRALSPGMRQFSDGQMRQLIGRDGVVGVVIHNKMLRGGWESGVSPRSQVTLADAANHIDHLCQLAGDADHVAIGSDLDGGYNVTRCPADLDTIADLQKIAPILDQRGYREADIAAIFHGNWLRFLRRIL